MLWDLFFLFTLINPANRCDVAVYFTPGPDCENNIIAAINSAHTINVAVYAITNENIGNALVSAYNRGADIKIITDRTQSHHKSSLVPVFRKLGIPVKTNNHYKIEHNKFAVFDERTTVSGSYNWTSNASHSNSENCLFIKNCDTPYMSQFQKLWHIYDQ